MRCARSIWRMTSSYLENLRFRPHQIIVDGIPTGEKHLRFQPKQIRMDGALEYADLNCFFFISRIYGQLARSFVARNSKLCGSKFYSAQQYPSIPIAICRACFFWSKIIQRDILIIYLACFVVNQGLKSEIYYTFIPLV